MDYYHGQRGAANNFFMPKAFDYIVFFFLFAFGFGGHHLAASRHAKIRINNILDSITIMRAHQGLILDSGSVGNLTNSIVSKDGDFKIRDLLIVRGKKILLQRTFDTQIPLPLSSLLGFDINSSVDYLTINVRMVPTSSQLLQALSFALAIATIGALTLHFVRYFTKKRHLELLAEEKFKLSIKLAHDIRGPLSLAQASLLQNDPERASSLLNRIEIISEELLENAKINRGVETQLIDLSGVASECMSDAKDIATSRQKAEVVFALEKALFPLYFRARSHDFRRCLDNILLNAIEASPLFGKITLSTSCRDDEFRLEVTDQGFGFSQDYLAAPFKFGTSLKSKGNGFGLSSAFEYLKSIGGRIALRNLVNGGASVTIIVPPHFKFSSNATVILLDDEEDFRSLWTKSANAALINFRAFANAKDMFDHEPEFPPKTFFFIDYERKNDAPFSTVMEQLERRGRTQIVITSAHSPNAIISKKEVIGKIPPFMPQKY